MIGEPDKKNLQNRAKIEGRKRPGAIPALSNS